MICLMHESETGYSLESGGTPWTDNEIVDGVPGSASVLLDAFEELFAKGVAKRNARGAVFSNRLKEEVEMRAQKATAGSMGGSKRQANRLAKAKQTPYHPSDSDSTSKEERKREPAAESDPLHAWIVARWYPSGVTEADAAVIAETLEGLELKGGTTVRCEVVCKRFALKWPNATLTPRAMLKHWDTFLQEPAAERTVTYGLNRRENAERKAEMHRETIKKWYAGLDEFTRARLWKETRAGMVAKAVTEDILTECDANEGDRPAWMYHHERLRLGHGPEYERTGPDGK